jgi:hypothetical protein
LSSPFLIFSLAFWFQVPKYLAAFCRQWGNIWGPLSSSCEPGFPDWEIAPRAKQAPVEVVKFKCLSVYLSFTAWKDSFPCVDPLSGSTFWLIFDPSAGDRRKLAWASGMPRFFHW